MVEGKKKKRHFKWIFCGKMVCLGAFRAQTQQPKQAEGHCEAQHSVFAAAHGWLIRKVSPSRIARGTGNGRTAANGPWPSSKALSIPKLVPRPVCLPPPARESQPPTSAAVSVRRTARSSSCSWHGDDVEASLEPRLCC